MSEGSLFATDLPFEPHLELCTGCTKPDCCSACWLKLSPKERASLRVGKWKKPWAQLRLPFLLAAFLSCASWHFPKNGRVYTTPHNHLGVQPAYETQGAGVTVQWSTDALP